MSSDEARAEAERRYRLWLPTGDYEIDRENYSELDAEWQNAEAESQRQAFEAGAEWQAARDAERIAEMEAELVGIKRRDAEVGEDEGWWVGGAWSDYGEAVVPLRILSYVIDGKLDEKVTSIDPGFALTYAEQTARAEAVEAKLAEVRERLVHLADAQQSWINAGRHEQAISREAIRDRAREIVAVLDGEADHADPS